MKRRTNQGRPSSRTVLAVVACMSALLLAAASSGTPQSGHPGASDSADTTNGSAGDTATARDPSDAASPSPQVSGQVSSQAPPQEGYFSLRPVGSWLSLPDGDTCVNSVHRSTWEPRPDNDKRNHVMPNPQAVRRAFAARPMSGDGSHDRRWDNWLLVRVDGQFTGTTDEIFQWAACKWGLPDNTLRAVAVRESTWYQYETYPSGRPVVEWGSGDMMPDGTDGADVYCDAIARYGYDYQQDFSPAICPQTFSIAGIKSWQSPAWGVMPDNQNGTFPFSRDSTPFAVDYLASQLRGCFEGWAMWLDKTGTQQYAAGDLWGCVGAWYSGAWHSSAASDYISLVEGELTNLTWLGPVWPLIKPKCHPTFGCPGPDPL